MKRALAITLAILAGPAVLAVFPGEVRAQSRATVRRGEVAAAPPGAPPVGSAPRSSSVRDALPPDARERFDEGARLYQHAQYAEARHAFLAAQAASGDARVLFNVAVCDKALGRYASAIQTMQRSLSAVGQPLPAEYVERVDVAIATLSKHVARVRVESSVEGAQLTVDGEPLDENPVPVDPGTHTFAARRTGFEPATATVTVRAGQVERVDLSPTPSPIGLANVRCAGVERCTIYVDDELLGTAPLTFSRGAGTYRVRATVDGRPFREQSVELRVGASVDVILVAPPMASAHLRVTTDRADDAFTVDGRAAGLSGAAVELAPGEHRVLIARSGRAARTLDVLLREGETRDLRIAVEEGKGVSPWWIAAGAVLVGGIVATSVAVATAPTRFEGGSAGTLTPFVVPVSTGGTLR